MNVQQRAPVPSESVFAHVVARTERKLRFHVRDGDDTNLFIRLELVVGAKLIVSGDYETVAATVLGFPNSDGHRARFVEVELRADIDPRTKVVQLRRSVLGESKP